MNKVLSAASAITLVVAGVFVGFKGAELVAKSGGSLGGAAYLLYSKATRVASDFSNKLMLRIEEARTRI